MAKTSLASFISNRLEYQSGNTFSSTVIKISKISIALGVSILIISLLIYSGFRQEIQNRIFSVSGQISLRQFTQGTLYEEKPLEKNATFIENLRKLPDVFHVQSFAFKPALISTESEVSGIILKGVGNDFNLKAFSPNLAFICKNPPKQDEIWISQKTASSLQLKRNMQVVLFFMQNPPRYRKVKITGIYQTGLEDIDNNVAYVSQNLIQELNEWNTNQIGGFEVFVKDFNQFDFAINNIANNLPYNIGIEPITQTYIQLFDWLDVIGRNVLVMFILISLVAGFNMAATLLIMVLERRQMIGVLKALGGNNKLIRKIFIRNGLKIMFYGMLWGNGIAFFLCVLQQKFNLIPLNPENYYLSSVPISWNWQGIIGINLGVLFITWLVILIPIRIVNKVQPAEAVRSI
jgi:lipoprotein-releasing system permease protein